MSLSTRYAPFSHRLERHLRAQLLTCTLVGNPQDVTASSLRAVLSAASGASESAEDRLKTVEDTVLLRA